MIVSKDDFPIYETSIPQLVKNAKYGESKAKHNMDATSHLFEFILNASLDPIEEKQWHTPSMYFKNVDKYQELSINCLVTPSNTKFLLLHENRSDDQIKAFFNEVYDLFVRIMLNPFYDSTSKIDVPQFGDRVQHAIRKNFN